MDIFNPPLANRKVETEKQTKHLLVNEDSFNPPVVRSEVETLSQNQLNVVALSLSTRLLSGVDLKPPRKYQLQRFALAFSFLPSNTTTA